MRTGRSHGIVHRHYRPQHNRWMYQPQHMRERKKIDWENVVEWTVAWIALVAVIFTVGWLWLTCQI